MPMNSEMRPPQRMQRVQVAADGVGAEPVGRLRRQEDDVLGARVADQPALAVRARSRARARTASEMISEHDDAGDRGPVAQEAADGELER